MAAKPSEHVGGVPLQVKCYICSLTNQSELASMESVGIPAPPHLWLHLLAAGVASHCFALPDLQSVSVLAFGAGAPSALQTYYQNLGHTLK